MSLLYFCSNILYSKSAWRKLTCFYFWLLRRTPLRHSAAPLLRLPPPAGRPFVCLFVCCCCGCNLGTQDVQDIRGYATYICAYLDAYGCMHISTHKCTNKTKTRRTGRPFNIYFIHVVPMKDWHFPMLQGTRPWDWYFHGRRGLAGWQVPIAGAKISCKWIQTHRCEWIAKRCECFFERERWLIINKVHKEHLKIF